MSCYVSHHYTLIDVIRCLVPVLGSSQVTGVCVSFSLLFLVNRCFILLTPKQFSCTIIKKKTNLLLKVFFFNVYIAFNVAETS